MFNTNFQTFASFIAAHVMQFAAGQGAGEFQNHDVILTFIHFSKIRILPADAAYWGSKPVPLYCWKIDKPKKRHCKIRNAKPPMTQIWWRNPEQIGFLQKRNPIRGLQLFWNNWLLIIRSVNKLQTSLHFYIIKTQFFCDRNFNWSFFTQLNGENSYIMLHPSDLIRQRNR